MPEEAPPQAISGGTAQAVVSTSPCATGEKPKCVVIIVGKEPINFPTTYAICWTYPDRLFIKSDLHKNLYKVPLYKVRVCKAMDKDDESSYCEDVYFEGVRFVVCTVGGMHSVIGMDTSRDENKKEIKWHAAHVECYSPRSSNGIQKPYKLRVKNSFLIHEGPMGDWDYTWGSYGCVEIFGEWKFNEFMQVITNYTEAEKMDEAGKKIPIFVRYEQIPESQRPTLTMFPQLTKDEHAKLKSSLSSRFKEVGVQSDPQYPW